jgi:hypothetical protein
MRIIVKGLDENYQYKEESYEVGPDPITTGLFTWTGDYFRLNQELRKMWKSGEYIGKNGIMTSLTTAG